jgi:hypothetical protein
MIIKKHLKLIILFSIINILKADGQLNLGIEGGISYNKLQFVNNADNIFLSRRIGYIFNINAEHKLNKSFILEVSPGLIQKNYSITNTRGIFQNVDNNYLILPIGLKYKINIIPKLTFIPSLGVYYGYWLTSKIQGVQPNVFDTSTDLDKNEIVGLKNINYAYSLNTVYDQRNELGWLTKLSISFRIKEKTSCSITTQYYQSITDQQKNRNNDLQNPKYNQTFNITTGIMYHLNK